MAPADTFGSKVYRVGVQMPPFWPDWQALWFAQAKEQYELAAVMRQRTKFKYMVAELHQQHTTEVENITTGDWLKAELVGRLSTSHEERVRQFHSQEENGDCKPSHFLQHLTQDVPDDFLPTFWASRLLPHAKAILAGQTECSLDSTSLTGFASSFNPPHLASPLWCPTTQPGYCNVWRIFHSKWCHKPAAAHTPHKLPWPNKLGIVL
jgi:hypothetical protein